MMSKNNGKYPKSSETTAAGLMEAIASGDLSAQELIDILEANPQLMGRGDPAATMKRFSRMAKRGALPGAEDEEDNKEAAAAAGCPAPGSKIKSKGRGRGMARGRGRGPMGNPPMESEEEPSAVVPDSALTLATFESMVDEACGLKSKKPKKKKKSKKSKMKDATESKKSGKPRVLEFAAPERQDVIRWARGAEPKRIGEGKTPFWFDGDTMISAGTPVAKRDLKEKKAQVAHPKNLSAYTGRHAVLANMGLRYAGYDVEVVDKL
jgi:hypothetical protein